MHIACPIRCDLASQLPTVGKPNLLIRENDMTKEEAIETLKTLAKDDDTEVAHKEADVVLCQLLFTLGYGDVVAEYHRVYKWYA